jgi:hypothetical protein
LYGEIGTNGNNPSKASYITNHLSCSVKKKVVHKMNLYAMGYFYHSGSATVHGLGYFTIHLGYSACDSNQLIYQSPIMYDTLRWYKYEFEFIPNDNYAYIGIQAHQGSTGGVVDILIDDFSPIVVEVPNTAHIQVTNINGNCYNLQSSIVNGIEAVRYEWKNQTAVISRQSAVDNVCINEATTIYLTAWDACGYAYVDSFNFTANELKTVYQFDNGNLTVSLIPYYKPLQLQLYNDVGQLVSFATIPMQAADYTINIAHLPKGIYFITIVSDKRLMKQKIWKY